VINVFADGTYDLDGQPATLDELKTRLSDARERIGKPTVVIRGDAACAFQKVASALAACKAADISELGITVRIADAGGPALH
jgi:biopolymer transport protein ExbD